MIDTRGKPIENAITIQPINTTKATIADSFQTSHLQDNDDLLHFEFFIPSKDVVKYIFTPPDERRDKEEEEEDKDQFWINGVLDKHTGEVISASIGRISQPE